MKNWSGSGPLLLKTIGRCPSTGCVKRRLSAFVESMKKSSCRNPFGIRSLLQMPGSAPKRAATDVVGAVMAADSAALTASWIVVCSGALRPKT